MVHQSFFSAKNIVVSYFYISHIVAVCYVKNKNKSRDNVSLNEITPHLISG